MIDMNKAKEKLQSALSIGRYKHTLGVVETAEKLAVFYGVEVEKAKIAALLHDCAKDYPSELTTRLCKECHIKIDDVIRKNINLAHGFLGAKVAKKEYEVHDKEILDAIKYHTFGRENMTLLDKIIFIADYIEPNREDFAGLTEVRKLAYEDIDKAMIVALQTTIQFTEAKKNPNKNTVHTLSREALAYLQKQGGVL